MASTITTTRSKRAFKKLEKDPVLADLAVAGFKYPVTKGLRLELEKRQGTWAPNAPEYAERKRQQGHGAQPWVRTGRTLKAITANVFKTLGTKKGLKLGMNWRNLRAFASPRTFTDSKGAKLPPEKQSLVFNTLRKGTARFKLGKTAIRLGATVDSVIEGIIGFGGGNRTVPGRPLFEWVVTWIPEVKREMEAAIAIAAKKAGFDAKS